MQAPLHVQATGVWEQLQEGLDATGAGGAAHTAAAARLALLHGGILQKYKKDMTRIIVKSILCFK